MVQHRQCRSCDWSVENLGSAGIEAVLAASGQEKYMGGEVVFPRPDRRTRLRECKWQMSRAGCPAAEGACSCTRSKQSDRMREARGCD